MEKEKQYADKDGKVFGEQFLWDIFIQPTCKKTPTSTSRSS